MMYRALALGALAAPLAFAAPAKRQDIDTTVLQFALTLEHLENVFYHGALQKFSEADFAAAGYGPNYYNNLKYISFDEESHVRFLSTALTAAGQKPAGACEYKFPYTDVKSFITLSTVLEGVGTSAYLGAAGLITNKDYLTAAGAILVTEALHTSLQRNAINAVPNANAYGTPLEPNSVYSLAVMFITSCPNGATLPFMAYPTLTFAGTPAYGEQPNLAATQAKREANWESYGTTTKAPAPAPTSTCKAKHPVAQAPSAGDKVSFTGASAVPAGSFVTFVSGLDVVSVPGEISGSTVSAAIPSVAAGQVYVFVTKAAASMNKLDTMNGNILFGPSVIDVKPAPAVLDFNYSK